MRAIKYETSSPNLPTFGEGQGGGSRVSVADDHARFPHPNPSPCWAHVGGGGPPVVLLALTGARHHIRWSAVGRPAIADRVAVRPLNDTGLDAANSRSARAF